LRRDGGRGVVFGFGFWEKDWGWVGDNGMAFSEKLRELVLNQDGRDGRMDQDLGFEPG